MIARTYVVLMSSVLLLFLVSGPVRGQSFAREYFRAALQGDISGPLNKVKSSTQEELSESLSADDLELAAKIRSRFVDRQDVDDELTDNPFVNDVIVLHKSYWIKRLTGELDEAEGRQFLEQGAARILQQHGLQEAADTEASPGDFLAKQLKTVGFEYLGGVTLPHRELMLWRNNERTDYQVELTDKTQPVTVVFMEDFVVRGWLHYATFGRSSAGGWATQEELYCVGGSYNVAEEKFLVSYLKHEARHFADYRIYPKLEQPDLEYRAKLTELVFAESTQQRILQHLLAQSSNDKGASPHMLASHAVIASLSREIFDRDFEADMNAWRNISGDVVSKNAKKLLEQHSAALDEAGRETTTGLIKPREDD